jgi:dihydropyrimidine dehydrogenase (NAD+) subunit PreA/dihydroorotate dehydrogenase (NAD+) catalytic subunit
VDLGPLQLANPVVAASSEFTMTEDGIRACVDAGAGAVIAKSINEDPASGQQLAMAEYLLVGPDHRRRPWSAPKMSYSLFNQSGLAPTTLDDWVGMLERCERYARSAGSRVIGSITVSEPEPAGAIAAAMSEVVSCVELNLSAPHGKDSGGAVRQVGHPEGVAMYTRAVRAATDVPLIVKLTAQTVNVVDLARAAVDAGADVVSMIGRFQGFLPDLEAPEPLLGSVGAIGGGWALPTRLYWVRATHLALPNIPIVGTNGARDGSDVLRFLLSGARAVELASAVLIAGPHVLGEAVDTVRDYLVDQGKDDVRAIIGAAATAARSYAELRAERAGRPLRFPWAQPSPAATRRHGL